MTENFDKAFANIIKNTKDEINGYTMTRYTDTLMDILIIADPCISKFTLKVEIINNKLRVIHSPSEKAGLFKRRSEGIIILLEKTLLEHKISDCVLFIHVKDTYIKFDEPFFIYARPQNKKGILIPDHSFIDAEPEKKITKEKGGVMVGVDEIRAKAKRDTLPKNKKNSLFFIGQNVPLINSDFFFRKYFASLKWPFEVKTTGYLNMGEYSKWKYLLNLPGWYPWSFRFKFLFLMNSFIINVNLLRPELDEGKWIGIIDALFIPGKDYIEIDFNFNPDDIGLLSYSINEVFKKYNYSKQNFDKIVANGKKKGDLITLKNIYTLNARVFNLYQQATSKILRDIEHNLIEEYQTKLDLSLNSLIYSNISKIYRLSDKYVVKCYPCSMEAYSELKCYSIIANKINGILKLYDCFILDNIIYFILDVGDINLYQYALAYKIKRKVLQKIIDDLHCIITKLHCLNICHNAINPENILFSYKTEKFYLIDFKHASHECSEIQKEQDLKSIQTLGDGITDYIYDITSKYLEKTTSIEVNSKKEGVINI